MKLVDQELVYELPGGWISDRAPSKKYVLHQYEFSDHNDATHMGRGPTRLAVKGLADTAALESLEHATTVATLYTLYYPSEPGLPEDDRYYQRVLLMPVVSQPVKADLHRYSIEMHALDGHAYDAETGRQVD